MDTLFINKNGNYNRKAIYDRRIKQHSGRWEFIEKDIGFSNWTNLGESEFLASEPKYSVFNYREGILGSNQIYYDVDSDKFFYKIANE
jgi:hypothetical protein